MLVWDEEKKCYVGKFVVGSDGCSDIISIGLQKMEGNVSVELLGLNPSFPNLEKTIRIIDCSSYNLTPSSLNVSEGGSVTVTLETDAGVGDYYYTISGPSITEDDIQEGLTGKFSVDGSGTGDITLNISSDAIVENLETFTLELDNKKASVSINISDIYYSVSSNPPTANEGDTVTVTVSTNAPDGSCNYSLSGSTGFSVADDLEGNMSSTGTVNIQNGTGTVTFTVKEDLITEGQESFTFQLIGCGGDPSVTVVVNDTSTNPIDYSVTANPPTANEGDTVTITVTTNAPDGSCNYSLSGSTGFSVANDFDGNVSSTGTVNIQNGTGTVSFTLKEDLITEGQESFTFQLVGCGNNPSTTVTVNDTSTEPITYSVAANPPTANEGDTVTVTVSTNAPDGSCNYSLSGSTGFSVTDDFDGNVSSTGTINIQNGTGQVSFTLKEDLITEGQESFTFQLSGCGNNPSTTVTVNDTSTEPLDPTYSLSVNPYVGGEGDTVTFTLTTTNVPENTQVPYTISGEVELSDFNPPLTSYTGHYFTVGSNGIATQQYTYADDGAPSNFSKSFVVTLDNITPEVSVFGVFTESDIIPPTITIEGHGMTGMLDATHEGYAYGWSDIIVNKEGQYTWSITTSSGNITTSDFSDVRIDGESIDYSTLSGDFNVTFNEYDNGSTRVMFWIYMAEDNLSELPYEELTLTITYVPDESYATSTIKIYDMPTSYSTLYHDLPYGETWDPGESVTFELKYNLTSLNEMKGDDVNLNWIITSTGSGQNIDINDIESVERWHDGDTTPVIFDFGPPYGLQQDVNGDIEGWFSTNTPIAHEIAKSYIKITLKSTASLGGKQMRFKLKDPAPTISTPSQFDYVFAGAPQPTYSLVGGYNSDEDGLIVTLNTTNVPDSTNVSYTVTGQDNAGNIIEQSWFDANSDLITGNFTVSGNTATIEFVRVGLRNITSFIVTLDNITPTVSSENLRDYLS